ncbi:hypothetical protein IFM89_014407 [Coptis chinensis]|uniref:Polyadenylate-binding protein n=1 Tax=Coptis chinensis TaxID=261450 RepID=A0A835I3A6_9MAGN|nr:hypothetical protein IFM89_014407 [Coptis chinensis]
MTNTTSNATTLPAEKPSSSGVIKADLFEKCSLYVGDLDENVEEGYLYDLFSSVVGPIASVRVCRDQSTRASLGYAYVNFTNNHDAIDNKALYDKFYAFGAVLSSKVERDTNGQSKGYGFVQFESEEAAQNAIKGLDKTLINDKEVYVGLFVRRQERSQADRSSMFTNVYVKNLSETTSDEDLKKVFGHYGPVTSAVVIRDGNGNSQGFGFVNFENPENAVVAIEKLNGATVDNKVWYVGRAQKKAEREAELKATFKQERNGRFEKLHGTNLYVKNLDSSFHDGTLEELFSRFGTVISCKVMLDPFGQSTGAGFVAFSTPEEANRAVSEMNGKVIGFKPLYVAVAQRKEERKARLQEQFAQIRAPFNVAPVLSGMPGFHPGGPRLPPPQLYFGPGGPGFLPPPAYGFQQQLLPGIRPGIAPNYIAPYPHQRPAQPGQRMGARRSRTSRQMQQMLVRNANREFRYTPNVPNTVGPSLVPQRLPFDASVLPTTLCEAQRPTLASALASAGPERQRAMLGEQLFPLVQCFEHALAAKVTGMLLEMDQTEVLHLIESPDSLKRKVNEAMAVIRIVSSGLEFPDALKKKVEDAVRLVSSGCDAADQLGTLSLKD